ncbi:hypothetical protein R1sor_001583 [Riccia sorocarpa]|uniref:Uncharacterized protein n=1 Tax=Riccia sorocarpa TaxID=122646 RepID=A0ABD3H0H9_9MARC
MASISSKAIHALVQQLDIAAVQANKDADSTLGEGDGYAALLLESLGIDNWITVLHTFMTAGEDATITHIRQLHEDLPALLETDVEEEGRASELAKVIGKALSWIDLEKSVIPGEVESTPDTCTVDVPALVKSNPLICFDVFSSDEQTQLNDSLDGLHSSQIDDPEPDEVLPEKQLILLPHGRYALQRNRVQRSSGFIHVLYVNRAFEWVSIRKIIMATLSFGHLDEYNDIVDDLLIGWWHLPALTSACYNPTDTFINFSVDDVSAMDDNCACQSRFYQPFTDHHTMSEAHGNYNPAPHVRTMDVSLIKNLALREVFGYGLNHIPLQKTLLAPIVNQILEAWDTLMGKWIPELTKLGYDDNLPVPINTAIQVTMASISSKAIHALVQQLDIAAVQANKDADSTLGEGDGYAALLLESLGIDNWITVLHTFMTAGEDATITHIRQLHEDLPALLETDVEEEGRASELAKVIGKALSWIDLEKSVIPGEVESTPDTCTVDVPALVKSNPLICFDVFSSDEQTQLNDSLIH